MKIEITISKEYTKTIDVELPYYYKHDLYSDYDDSIIYGKIDKNTQHTIHESIALNYSHDKSYEIKTSTHRSIKNSGLSCYFEKEHVSNKEEYESIKKKAIIFLNNF